MAIAAWDEAWRVSLAVVTPHLTWIGPSMWMFYPKTAKEARVLDILQMAVSSVLPA